MNIVHPSRQRYLIILNTNANRIYPRDRQRKAPKRRAIPPPNFGSKYEAEKWYFLKFEDDDNP
jgi:hypothetical protein